MDDSLLALKVKTSIRTDELLKVDIHSFKLSRKKKSK